MYTNIRNTLHLSYHILYITFCISYFLFNYIVFLCWSITLFSRLYHYWKKLLEEFFFFFLWCLIVLLEQIENCILSVLCNYFIGTNYIFYMLSLLFAFGRTMYSLGLPLLFVLSIVFQGQSKATLSRIYHLKVSFLVPLYFIIDFLWTVFTIVFKMD